VAKVDKKSNRVDPSWPGEQDEHPVTELASDRQGSLSPFGDVSFPLPAEKVPYEHPVTVVNK
jgi:hypothetical protein